MPAYFGSILIAVISLCYNPQGDLTLGAVWKLTDAALFSISPSRNI